MKRHHPRLLTQKVQEEQNRQLLRKCLVNCRGECPHWLLLTFMKYLTSRPENRRPHPPHPSQDLVRQPSPCGPQGSRGPAAVLFPPPLPSPTSPPPSILGWPRLQECDGISANRQSVPRGAGAAPRRPHSPSHSKHKGLSSLSAWLSSSGDSLPAGDSLQSDKLLGPLLAVLLGL